MATWRTSKMVTRALLVLALLSVFGERALPQFTAAISVAPGGSVGNGYSLVSLDRGLSSDARYVVFASNASNLVATDTNGYRDVYVRDLQIGVTTLVSVDSAASQGNDGSGYGFAISGDGQYVAFLSRATNLVAADTNGAQDVFVRDRT